MACGNNDVAREVVRVNESLVSQAMVQHVLNPPHSVPPPPVTLPRAPEHPKWGKINKDDEMGQMSYTELDAEGNIHAFIDPDGQPTFHPERHIHVIHHETENSTTLVLTDRTQEGNRNAQHPLKIKLKDSPSGQDVQDAVAAMVDVMNSIPRGPRREGL